MTDYRMNLREHVVFLGDKVSLVTAALGYKTVKMKFKVKNLQYLQSVIVMTRHMNEVELYVNASVDNIRSWLDIAGFQLAEHKFVTDAGTRP